MKEKLEKYVHDKMSSCFATNQVQKDYEMAKYWSTSLRYLVMSPPINSRITRRKSVGLFHTLFAVFLEVWTQKSLFPKLLLML